MRATFLVVLAVFATMAVDDERQRYLVIPTGDHVDMLVHCPAAFSLDGRVVAFDALASFDPADTNGQFDVYVLDVDSRHLTLISRGRSGMSARGDSRCPRISDDGQRIVFESLADDLVDDDVPGTGDVFLFDLSVGTVRRVSVLPGAGPSMSGTPAISGDGRFAVFHARVERDTDRNLTHVHRVALDGNTPPQDLGPGSHPTINGDGRVVAYVARPGGAGTSVVRVRDATATRTVAQPAQGVADGDAYAPMVSADGRWLAYVSRATNLMATQRLSGRPQVYLERLDDGQRWLISVTSQGREANGYAAAPSIDATGRHVVFHSTATNLGCGTRGLPDCDEDINLLPDVFLWSGPTEGVSRVTMRTAGLPWLEGAGHPAVSPDGRMIAFRSRQPISAADDLVTYDLFIRQR